MRVGAQTRGAGEGPGKGLGEGSSPNPWPVERWEVANIRSYARVGARVGGLVKGLTRDLVKGLAKGAEATELRGRRLEAVPYCLGKVADESVVLVLGL